MVKTKLPTRRLFLSGGGATLAAALTAPTLFELLSSPLLAQESTQICNPAFNNPLGYGLDSWLALTPAEYSIQNVMLPPDKISDFMERKINDGVLDNADTLASLKDKDMEISKVRAWIAKTAIMPLFYLNAIDKFKSNHSIAKDSGITVRDAMIALYDHMSAHVYSGYIRVLWKQKHGKPLNGDDIRDENLCLKAMGKTEAWHVPISDDVIMPLKPHDEGTIYRLAHGFRPLDFPRMFEHLGIPKRMLNGNPSDLCAIKLNNYANMQGYRPFPTAANNQIAAAPRPN